MAQISAGCRVRLGRASIILIATAAMARSPDTATMAGVTTVLSRISPPHSVTVAFFASK